MLTKKHLAAALAAGATVASGLIFATGHGCAATNASACPTPSFANYFISTTGNNASAGTTSGTAWLTFQKAYASATDGTTIEVAPGDYPSDASLGGTDRYIDSAVTHTIPVTFQCKAGAANDSVTFDAYWLDIRKASGVNFSGRCFQFPSFKVGEGGDGGVKATNITATNVHMGTFEIRGGTNITIQNSEVGPSLSCARPGKYAGTDARECANSSTYVNEAWGYANLDLAKYTAFTDALEANYGYGEAQVGGNSNTLPTGFQYIGNHQHDFNGLDTNGVGGHEGCIQFNSDGDMGGMVIRGNTFERAAVLCLLFDHAGASSTDTGWSNITIENNQFGPIVFNTDDASNPGCCTEAATTQRDLIFKQERTSQAITLSNVLIRYNSFAHGLTLNNGSITQTYSSVRVIGNILGQSSVCPSGSGFTFDRNVWVNASAGCGEAHFTTVTYSGSSPYSTYSSGSSVTSTQVANFTLAAGVQAALCDYVTETTSDYALTTDVLGVARPSGLRAPGANEC